MILPSGVPFVSRRERDAFTKPRRECGDSSHITHSTQNFSLLQQQADNRSTALKKTNEDLRLRQTKKKLWTVRGKRRSETEIEEGIEEQREAEREREKENQRDRIVRTKDKTETESNARAKYFLSFNTSERERERKRERGKAID